MTVKRSSSAARTLKAFERIAALQPIGVSALARDMGVDKSAVQRDLMTLADTGWIRQAPGAVAQWELTPHILTLSRAPHSSDALRRRTRPVLERLRNDTGETAYLTVPSGANFVVLDAMESRQILRMAPPIGTVVPALGSATGRVIIPHLSAAEQERLLGSPPTPGMTEEFAATRARGYAINDGDIAPGALAMAAPIFGSRGVPAGTLVVTGPSERFPQDERAALGERLRQEALALSAG